ncbi:phosphatases II [Tilletiaria anomala UBC 951]|uniref:Phosphatases II n=1 Tax=Tilletiaria anomala (strain ATCC 24038 / CBS 436.72 / UBC 951) TaxID=1037660 RepID=A0A066VUD9_TILAU|nr:phosphatases II [Tilletiaria anomala UBC 951]KDN42414.1 phosphatases II [Tilletiaria anomala UBC 951]
MALTEAPTELSRMGEASERTLEDLLYELDALDTERCGGLHRKEFAVDAAVSEENSHHNRYGDICSYDHALLDGEYLNASLIPPCPRSESLQAYIASQAPLPHTFDRFYSALFQQRAPLLINLTPLREKGRRKADQYWPDWAATDGQPIEVGDGWTVATTSEEPIETPFKDVDGDGWELVKRTLELRQTDAGGVTRKRHGLTLFHLTTWPDHGASSLEGYEHLLHLIQQETWLAASRNASSGAEVPPIWIHCSAGVGRTGTVIAGLMALEMQNRNQLGSKPLTQAGCDHITAELIAHLRRYRPRMVQGIKQAEMVSALIAKLSAGSA